jgi:hypothetical protein
MESVGTIQNTQDVLLKILLDSMLKPQELAQKLVAVNAQQTIDAAKMESLGDIVDLYA